MAKYTFRKNAEIGKLEAESDSFLEECFYESDVFKGLLDFDSSDKNPDFTRRIIVGRTGSGKTALLKKIVSSNYVKVHETIEAENTVFEHINNNVFIAGLIKEGIDLRVFYKSLWLHVLLVNVINQLHRASYQSFFELIKGLSPKKAYNSALANEYLESYKENFFNDNVVTEIAEKMQRELSGKGNVAIVNVQGKEISEAHEKVQSETSQYVSKELLRKQKELIKILKEEFSNEKQLRIVISIDDLDKSWLSASSIRYDFINALLEAFRELLDIKSVKILISIRTDIIMGIYTDTLRQEEKDESMIYAISWNKKEIREILDKRINFLVKNQYSGSTKIKLEDVFDFKVKGENADDYIIDRTMLRPRDGISFVNACLSECDGSLELNETMILSAEEKFYSTRKVALAKEWKSLYPHIKYYLDAISFIKTSSFEIERLDQRIASDALNFLVQKSMTTSSNNNTLVLEFHDLVKVWFTVGIIGIFKSKELIIYSSFEKQELDITDMNKKFVIHPLFFRH